jgi:anti-sigma regulatory factor (Ser/Thr protein kinase)
MRSSTQSFATATSELRRLSAWVRDCAQRAGLREEIAYRIELCVNEAAANIIIHGAVPGTFTVTFDQLDGRTCIVMRDQARPFNPLNHGPLPSFTSLEDAPTGGYGIHMIRSFASAMDYACEGDVNILTLWFDDRGPGFDTVAS